VYLLDSPPTFLTEDSTSGLIRVFSVDPSSAAISIVDPAQFFTYSSFINASYLTIWATAPLEMTFFKCPDLECSECDFYNNTEFRGICTACDPPSSVLD